MGGYIPTRMETQQHNYGECPPTVNCTQLLRLDLAAGYVGSWAQMLVELLCLAGILVDSNHPWNSPLGIYSHHVVKGLNRINNARVFITAFCPSSEYWVSTYQRPQIHESAYGYFGLHGLQNFGLCPFGSRFSYPPWFSLLANMICNY